jgi:hypothetical protein
MATSPVPALSSIPSAFAAACRLSRTEGELFERCRMALVRRFRSERIWFDVVSGSDSRVRVGPSDGFADATEVARLGSGETEVAIHADRDVAVDMRAVAMPLALGLSVVLELRSILLERQAALDDAVFQLRALRQVARLLSSVHSIEDTEQLILDFMAEVFFAWWGCLYRPDGAVYAPKVFRSLNDRLRPAPIDGAALDRALPAGSASVGAPAWSAPERSWWSRWMRERSGWPSWCWAPASATSSTGGPSWSWRAPFPSPRPSHSRIPSWWSSSTARLPPTS